MVGMIGEALSDKIELVDKELEDAKWFTREEVLAAFERPPAFSSAAEAVVGLKLPPQYAIAHSLIKYWAVGGSGSAKM
jgi:NAD+ diphosphatase